MGPTNGDSLNSIRDPTGDFKFYKKTLANNSTWQSSPKQTCWETLILTIWYSWSNNTCMLFLLLLFLLPLAKAPRYTGSNNNVLYSTFTLNTAANTMVWEKWSTLTVPAGCCNLAPSSLTTRHIVQIGTF
jgi:hypothetical protein